MANGRREWRIKKLARLAAYAAVVSLGLGALAARSVYGDVRASALSMGHELGQLGDVGTKRPLRLNGEPIFVASSTEDMSVKEVLDTTEARCRNGSAGAAAELADLSAALRAKLPAQVAGGSGAGVLRDERGDSGVVACVVRDDGQPALGYQEITARLGTLVTTGDLGALGRLRYVFAEKTSNGRTHVVAAWTEGSFNVLALLPPRDGGDTPGTDPKGAPRPPRAHRLLSADVEGVPYGVRIYDSAATPAEVAAHYDQAMPALGWQPSFGGPAQGGPAGIAPDQRAFQRPGADLMVFTSRDGDRTLVTLIEMTGK